MVGSQQIFANEYVKSKSYKRQIFFINNPNTVSYTLK
jgi:hypothetical protein